MVRPTPAQQAELRLDIPELGREQQESQEQHVVEGQARGGDLGPRKWWRTTNDPKEAGGRRQPDGAGNGQGADLLVVPGHEEPDSRREEKNPDVQKRPDLEANRDEALPSNPVEECGLA